MSEHKRNPGAGQRLVVIGAGPGGYVGAIRAAQLGMKVTIVERDKPGGVCLNIGCIPSKALIHQAEVFASMKELEMLGIRIDASSFDYRRAFQASRAAADRLSGGVKYLLDKSGVRWVGGSAVLADPHRVETREGERVIADYILLATGSRPRGLKELPFDGRRVLSSTDALMLERLPGRMLVIGSGAIGVELAHVLATFGVEVTLLEAMDRILPQEDSEISGILEKSFVKRGIRVLTGAGIVAWPSPAASDGEPLRFAVRDRRGVVENVEADQVLVSVGRVPNTEDIGLERLGIGMDEGGFVSVGAGGRTSVDSIFAIGDIVRTPLLAHVASKEAEIAVETMAGVARTTGINRLLVPGAIYCEPQVASFGLTEDRLMQDGRQYRKSMFPFRGIGKAVAAGKTEGIVKVLADAGTSEILGAHVVGPQATEIIHEMLLAAHAELLPEDVAGMMHAHPTLSEGVMESMMGIEGMPVHL